MRRTEIVRRHSRNDGFFCGGLEKSNKRWLLRLLAVAVVTCCLVAIYLLLWLLLTGWAGGRWVQLLSGEHSGGAFGVLVLELGVDFFG